VSWRSVFRLRPRLRFAQGRFDAGVGTILELTDAQLALTQAQNTQAQAPSDYRIALAQLDRAQTDQARAAYDATVAVYRQTVLAAFEEVEDNLAALRILQDEATEQDAAVKAAEQALSLITIQYKAGPVSYLNVIVAQATALSNEITAVAILGRRMVAAALLVKALGGGWSADNLPSTSEFLEPAPRTGRDARRPGAPPDGIGFMAR
jgi:outer membrane protein TolC